MASPIPIFVLGLQRSGTTWAGNLLAAHPQVAAVTAERHRGIHESVFFSHFAQIYGSWDDPDARRRALAAFARSDYAAIAGLSAARIAALGDAKRRPAAFFRAVMETLAHDQGAEAWVEKSPHHTLLAEHIAAMYPDAKFLCITRGSEEMTRSRLWAYGRHPPRYPKRAAVILRACASNAFHRRHLVRFARVLGPDRVRIVEFEQLKAEGGKALAGFLEICGLCKVPVLVSSHAANSSFTDPGARRYALGPADIALVGLAEFCVHALPQDMLRYLQLRIARRRAVRFPPWVWAQRGAARQGGEDCAASS